MRRPLAALLLALPGLPLLWALALALQAAWDGAAWQAVAANPQTAPAIAMTLWTGLASSALALALTASLLSHHFASALWQRLVRSLGAMLALPHVAFAIGLVALLSPSGWLLRLASPWATGFTAPPPWLTTQDPWGLGLMAVLVCKEVPFLLWAAATQLQRPEVADRLAREWLLARSLGYTRQRAWWRVLWPQLWPRLRWPMLAVLAYGLTVVDVALLIGPTSPPTLAVLAWRWLLEADAALNTQGAVAAWWLALLLAALAGAGWQLSRWPLWRRRWTGGQRGAKRAMRPAHLALLSSLWPLGLVYAAVLLALAVGSISGVWTFPALLPQTITWGAWQSVAHSLGTLGTTLSLALASATLALAWSLAWLECAPPGWGTGLRRIIYLPIVLPPVLWVSGLYALALHGGLDGRWSGLWLAHTLAALPYVLIALMPAYTGFDSRYAQLTASLGHGRWVFLTRVKWPLLKSALVSAWAVGFAVSVAQYLPTLFIGAGRLATVTTEAVTRAAGAQRSLTSAYAALQILLPLIAFALAAWLGRPRQFDPRRGVSK
jgi:putative thiamine transport system permease protein